MVMADKEKILAYVNDIAILYNIRQDVTQIILNLLVAIKMIELRIIEEKTKFMLLSRRKQDQSNLHVDNFAFEKLKNLEYLGMNKK